MDLIFTSVLIGIGLAMDCLAVSFAVGAHQKTSRIRAAFILALFFGGFQGGMTLLGWLAGTGFADAISSYDHWVAAGLLFIIGGKMIIDGIKDGHEEEAFHRAADPGVSEGGRGLDDPPSIMQRCALPASSLQIYGPE